MEKRFALLIDADNISAKYINPMLDELSKYGNITYKRIYGDWTSTNNSSWKDELLKNSINPIQQFSYTYGKNATDSAMIIDAMDILYTGKIDGFCIVSSDSDFTKLANRIRESGLTVVGMGEEKTPIPFRKACDIFTTLELLLEDDSDQTSDEKDAIISAKKTANTDVQISKKQIEDSVAKIITENENSGKETTLGEIGNRLVKMYPDFDVRSYGYSLLSKLLEEFPKIRLFKNGNIVTVTLTEDLIKRKNVEDYIIECTKNAGPEGVDLGALGNKIYMKYSDFKVSDYGYSQMIKYVSSINHIKVIQKNRIPRAIYID